MVNIYKGACKKLLIALNYLFTIFLMPLYKDIIISEERLQMIPEDGVPIEIQATTKHSTDIDSN